MESSSDQKENSFSAEIAKKEQRKLKAQRDKSGVWFGLGMMGMVGWSVTIPAVTGAVFGLWLDKAYPQSFSWTLTFLMAGIITGGIVAWYWVRKEDREMHHKEEEHE